jgi:hypothetical protein
MVVVHADKMQDTTQVRYCPMVLKNLLEVRG